MRTLSLNFCHHELSHLTSHHNGSSSDYSSFESIFFRLIQTMLDPPLEITWFYAAVTFHTAKKRSIPASSSRVLIAKDLLSLFIRCSNLSSASKKIALLAPIVYDVYSIVCDGRITEVNERIEVGKLVESMITEATTLSANTALVCFEDLVRVWTTELIGVGGVAGLLKLCGCSSLF